MCDRTLSPHGPPVHSPQLPRPKSKGVVAFPGGFLISLVSLGRVWDGVHYAY